MQTITASSKAQTHSCDAAAITQWLTVGGVAAKLSISSCVSQTFPEDYRNPWVRTGKQVRKDEVEEDIKKAEESVIELKVH